jgi:periplasmic divalent cation tolerance protein
MENVLIVFVTVSSQEEGERIGSSLVESKLAACVNVLPQVSSIFSWQGKIEKDGEVLLLIKTTRERMDDLAARIKEMHSYDLPEILAVPVFAGSRDYIDWVQQETNPKK